MWSTATKGRTTVIGLVLALSVQDVAETMRDPYFGWSIAFRGYRCAEIVCQSSCKILHAETQPETKGNSLEQIEAHWRSRKFPRLGARQNAAQQACPTRSPIEADWEFLAIASVHRRSWLLRFHCSRRSLHGFRRRCDLPFEWRRSAKPSVSVRGLCESFESVVGG